MGNRLKAVAMAALLAGSTQGAAADDERAALVQRSMKQAEAPFSERGFHYGGFSHAGALGKDQAEELAVTLGAGMQSVIFGACDNSCNDFDLVLLDPSGNEVASDRKTDDVPMVAVTPASDGTYRLRVTMVGCADDPCRYGLQQFVR